ncbi:MAG: TFIIB-type zinc ribbon-containing protein [Lacrimispora sp.]|uniref:TFIIB-type zinc ribbon-containing protein n=1 Tax=Lacrimispora sp. TaxID=2719234 RepID=UPI0039E6CEE8
MSDVLTYKCSNCGGPLKFDPEKQKYACEYCLSQFTQEEVASGEKEAPKAEKGGGEPFLYNCSSCGAEIVTDGTTAATFCYYCHNPVILSGRLSGEYNPDYVVPFAIEKEKAEDIFRMWMKKKRFVPKSFYSQDQIEKISGVYFPYMLYSCRAEGRLNASADRVRVWVSGNQRYTETQTFEVRREGSMPVKFVPRNALKKANRELVEGVLPYETEKMKKFSMPYLSGFLAERRDMGEQEFNEEVKAEVRSFAQDSLRNSITSYDSVRIESNDIRLEDEAWEYALLPVWALTYRDEGRDEMYYFTINGQTGKVCGKLPVDKGKLSLLFAEIFVPILIVLLIVGYLI